MGAIGKTLVAAAVIGTAAVFISPSDKNVGVVDHVIDGDTVDISIDGSVQRVRLLNVDTPEMGPPPDCLAQRATDYLNEQLPKGTSVRLEYDVEEKDKYGRLLAAVYKGEALINSEIAREGLGLSVSFGSNFRFLQEVRTAELEAHANTRGIHDPEAECTYPAQIAQPLATAETLAVASTVLMSEQELEVHLLDLKAAKYEIELIVKALRQSSSFTQVAFDEDKDWYGRAQKTEERIDKKINSTKGKVDRLEALAEEKERERKEEIESLNSKEAEVSSPKQPALSGSQMPSETGSAHTPTPQIGGGATAPAHDIETAPSPVAPPAGAAPKYTGCRAYGGNYVLDSVDEKGRPYAKIDCKTKQHL